MWRESHLEVPAPLVREVGGGLRVLEVVAVSPADELLRLGRLLLHPSRLVHRSCVQHMLDVHIRSDASRQGRRLLGQELSGPRVLLSVEQLHVRLGFGSSHLQPDCFLGSSGRTNGEGESVARTW